MHDRGPHRDRPDVTIDTSYAFEAAPVALWDEDWSGVAARFDELRASGVTDLARHLAGHPDEVDRCIGLVHVRRVNRAAAEMFGLCDGGRLEGPVPPETITVEGRDAFVRQFQRMWDGGTSIAVEMTGQSLKGRLVDLLLQWSLCVDDGVVDASRSLVAMTDISVRADSERRLEDMVMALSAIHRIGEEHSGKGDVELTLERTVNAAATLLGAGAACILLVDRDAEEVTRALACGIPDELLATFDFETVRDGIVGLVMDSCAPVLSPDIALDPRASAHLSETAHRFGPQSMAAAPVMVTGTAVGVLAALSGADRDGFTTEDVRKLELLAAQVSVAIGNAATFDAATRLNKELEETLAELRATQQSLLQAQKLESVGALAAGIAHEINTPIQYVGDNVRFLRDAFSDLVEVQQAAGALAAAQCDGLVEAADAYRAALEAADVEFLVEEVPPAVEQTLEGVQRVASIVRALKDFAHPGSDELTPTDLNRARENTTTVARNEWKYVAELDLDLDPELPLVPALAGPLNQAFLIIIVNAAQAIAEVIGETADTPETLGRILVRTTADEECAEIRISDTGGGIPESVRDRIFDPFFTTKEVGTGSGQGLPIARKVVVEQHQGSLEFEVEPGIGTTFVIRLPLTADS